MKLTGARLVNIACFEDLELDFRDEATGAPAPWVVILGENGTGKSTILQMTGATLVEPHQLPAIAGDVEWTEFIRAASDGQSVIRVEVAIVGNGDQSASKRASVLNFATRISKRRGLVPYGNQPASDASNQANHRAFLLNSIPIFGCGYGSSRRINRRQEAVANFGTPIPVRSYAEEPYRFASLFGNDAALTPVADWLAGLYFKTLHPSRTERDEDRFERAKKALFGRVLPQVTFEEITPDREVIVNDAGTRVSLARLSDGYRSTLAWVGDLVRRLFDAYPDSPDPLSESGVVLVDEIDLHLHPKWQRSIVEDLRTTFPNLQFIVTSHSPFVAQDMRPQDKIIVLERAEGEGDSGPVTARAEPGAVHDWSADQILASYFGLRHGTRGERAQKDAARYERLLDAETAGTLTEAQRSELERLRTRMNGAPIGETPDEQAFYEQADAVLAGLRRRREELERRRSGESADGEGHAG